MKEDFHMAEQNSEVTDVQVQDVEITTEMDEELNAMGKGEEGDAE